MLKVLNSKVCEKRTKACVKALKKVKKKKTSPTSHSHKHTHKHKDTHITHKHKHTKHRHKHKTTHGNHHNISINIGSDKKTTAPVVAPAAPFTPNPPPTGFVNYQQPAGAASVNRNDFLVLQTGLKHNREEMVSLAKYTKSKLEEIRKMNKKKNTSGDPFVEEERGGEQAPAGDGFDKERGDKGRRFGTPTGRPDPAAAEDAFGKPTKRKPGRPKGSLNKKPSKKLREAASALGGTTGSGSLMKEDFDDTGDFDGDLGGGAGAAEAGEESDPGGAGKGVGSDHT